MINSQFTWLGFKQQVLQLCQATGPSCLSHQNFKCCFKESDQIQVIIAGFHVVLKVHPCSSQIHKKVFSDSHNNIKSPIITRAIFMFKRSKIESNGSDGASKVCPEFIDPGVLFQRDQNIQVSHFIFFAKIFETCFRDLKEAST